MEVFDKGIVADAVSSALRLRAPSFDAVKQLILCRIERRPARLDLTAYPYLPKANVGKTCAADYSVLLQGAFPAKVDAGFASGNATKQREGAAA
jgi:hypothetical protein